MIQRILDFINHHRYELPDRSPEELKNICRILFIDDGEFDVPDILINSGWKNTKKVDDVESLDSLDIREADIVFVDIAGVGRKLRFSDEGLGLITALKEKYPHKRVVVYSAQRRGNRFHKGLSDADARLAKNADPFQFESLVEKFARESFSLPDFIQRLKEILSRELSTDYPEDEIRRILHRIGYKRDYSSSAVARAFKLQDAGSVASIVSLFLKES